MSIATAALSASGEIEAANAAFCETFEILQESALGREFASVWAERFSSPPPKSEGPTVLAEARGRTLRALRLALPAGGSAVVIEDVSEDLLLRDQARRGYRTIEDERTEIAREIHDELGQVLIGLKMELSAWVGSMKEGKEKGTGMLEALDRTIDEVRRITTKLRPLVLDDLGLAEAVEWQKQDFQSRTGIRCSFSRSGEVDVGKGAATAMFRIFQEALTNVARHADASQVSVVLKRQGEEAVLTVRDNGKGFSPEEPRKAAGTGLLGMKARAAAWGGNVRVSGVRGKGTMITVRIPFKEEKA